MSATYPENLRQEVERYLQGMRFSDEALAEAAGESAVAHPAGPARQPGRLDGIVEHARGTAPPSVLRDSRGASRATGELRQIADFIYTRTS